MKKFRVLALALALAILVTVVPASPANADYTLTSIYTSSKYWNGITASNDGTKIAAVAYQDGIYTSTDSGATFVNRTSAMSPQPAWNSIVSSADGRYLAAAAYTYNCSSSCTFDGGVYVSSDYGVNWSKVITPAQGGISSIAMSSDGSKLIAAVSNGGGNPGVIPIYLSNDFGSTWSNTNTGVPAAAISGNFFGLSISDDGVNLAASYGGVVSGFIYSRNSGASWTAVTSGIPTGDGRIAASSDGSKLALKVYGSPLYFSDNYGATWRDSDWSTGGSNGLTMSANGNVVVLIEDIFFYSTMYVSLDGGATRTSQNLSPGGMMGGSWLFSTNRTGTKVHLAKYRGNLYTFNLSAPMTAPGAPTIGAATALSPTSASISFTAPTSDGGATIETYTATSTPGSITGRVLQSGSGSITITGLTPSTAYTFSVTASNSAGTSASSGATVSITMPASQSEIDAAALAAQKAAEAKREAEKLAARVEISNYLKDSKVVNLGMFSKAEISGVTEANIASVQAEIAALPQTSRTDLSQVLKITRKYEVVGKIASDQFASVHSDSYIEIGLIPEGSKQKAALTAAIQKLPPSDRSSYASIQKAINAEMAEIQTRKDRLANVIARNASRYTK